MKTVKMFIAFVVVVVVVLLAAKYFNCGFVRDYTDNKDRTIQEVREKITDLEKDKIKDEKTLNILANQYSRLGTIYIEKNLWDLAIEYYEKAIKYGKNTPGIYYSAGLAYANRGSEKNSVDDIDRAEYFYKKAVAMQDNYYDAQNALAILMFYHKDDKAGATEIMERVVARNKKNYIARFTLGRFLYETGKLPRALSVYEDLAADLDRLPPSEIISDYKKNTRDNIQRIMTEMRKEKAKEKGD
jgi:tetratricopeptide (TPR) repeat protein